MAITIADTLLDFLHPICIDLIKMNIYLHQMLTQTLPRKMVLYCNVTAHKYMRKEKKRFLLTSTQQHLDFDMYTYYYKDLIKRQK